jgi:hypothetical protein
MLMFYTSSTLPIEEKVKLNSTESCPSSHLQLPGCHRESAIELATHTHGHDTHTQKVPSQPTSHPILPAPAAQLGWVGFGPPRSRDPARARLKMCSAPVRLEREGKSHGIAPAGIMDDAFCAAGGIDEDLPKACPDVSARLLFP